MLGQKLKDLYFAANRMLVMPNTLLIRMTHSSKKNLKLHLGCGDDYIDGLINVDGNIMRKKNLWLDFRNSLPFQSKSAKLIYCSHTLEHFLPDDALRFLREIRRVVADDGVVRLAVPSFERCLEIANGQDESHWPRDFEDSRSQAINYLFCDGQHKYAYCDGNLRAFAKLAGFSQIENYSSEHGVARKHYGDVEIGDEPKGSLIFELRR